MPDPTGLDSGARAEELLRLAERAAGKLIDGLGSLGFLKEPHEQPARVQVREEAHRLFVFVVLSVLLENRAGQDAADREVAARIKELYSLELVKARQALKSIARTKLPVSDAGKLGHDLDFAAHADPFAPYYDSFAQMARDPARGPFAILARRVTERHFHPKMRSIAQERVFTLAAVLSDELLERLGA